MQRGGKHSLFSAKRLPSCYCETERLTLPLELAPQLRLAHRVAEYWRNEFDEWLAGAPHYGWPPDGEDKRSVPLNLDTWCDAIGEGIKRIILDDLLSLSSIRNSEAATATQDAHPPSHRDRESNPNREEHIFRRRLLRMNRGFSRAYEVAQPAVKGKHAKLPLATFSGGVVRRSVARFFRSFVQGWREAIALYFSPLKAIYRAIRCTPTALAKSELQSRRLHLRIDRVSCSLKGRREQRAPLPAALRALAPLNPFRGYTANFSIHCLGARAEQSCRALRAADPRVTNAGRHADDLNIRFFFER